MTMILKRGENFAA